MDNWTHARELALQRDGNRCTVARLLGGSCRGRLHVHHIIPRSEGGSNAPDNLGTTCAKHHPTWEALRRHLVMARTRQWKRCPHRHATMEARRICEERLNRKAVA